MNIEKSDVINVLRNYKPDFLDGDPVSSGCINELNINGNNVNIECYLPEDKKELQDRLRAGITEFLSVRGLSVQSFVFVQERKSMGAGTPFDNQKKITGIKKIVAVASGKGGVGKSTVSSNLAVTLVKAGFKVGLMDADIYGPSMNMMMGVLNKKPTTPDGKKINPVENHGIKIMSMGLLTDPEQAVIWRGPMLMKAINQFLNDVLWGTLDYLLIDLPPGTGDVQLTLTQEVPLDGAIIVTTPQDVALMDVTRAVKMFEKVNVPVIGVVENMSSFICSECGHEEHIFGHGGGKKISQELGIELIAKIPLDKEVAISGDDGKPVVMKEKRFSEIYSELAKKL